MYFSLTVLDIKSQLVRINYVWNYSWSLVSRISISLDVLALNPVYLWNISDVVLTPEAIKIILTSDPVLRLTDPEKTFVLRTDALDYGIGAVLMQEHEGKLFPICYASRKLSDAERNYSTIECGVSRDFICIYTVYALYYRTNLLSI